MTHREKGIYNHPIPNKDYKPPKKDRLKSRSDRFNHLMATKSLTPDSVSNRIYEDEFPELRYLRYSLNTIVYGYYTIKYGSVIGIGYLLYYFLTH